MSVPTGIVLGQLGTPDAPQPAAVRRYLREFLSDPLVVDAPALIWKTVLNLGILPWYARRSAERYRTIWTRDGSPLKVITARQAQALGVFFSRQARVWPVAYGMRYGAPRLTEALDGLVSAGCRRILLFPMFPQFSRATSLSLERLAAEHLRRRHAGVALRTAKPFFNHAAYLAAVAAGINRALSAAAHPPEQLCLSYHGLPQRALASGEVYCQQCEQTTRALVPLLSFDPSRVVHSYQSRFGGGRWVGPDTAGVIRAAAARGLKRLAVACPGFSTDCLESLEEIGGAARRIFGEGGGEAFTLIPCLNDDPFWIEALARMVVEELAQAD